MRMRAVVMACALTFAAAAGAMAQSSVPGPGMKDGVVAEVDSAAGVVKLQDGRMYRVASGTELVFNGVPVPRQFTGQAVDPDPGGGQRSVMSYVETLQNGKTYTTFDQSPDHDGDTTDVYIVPEGHYFFMGKREEW